ncbi:MAG: alkaline phosphatase family protein [Candidatus Freyarchaeota archaeon]
MKWRLLVIGLDGATWDILMPLIKEGKLRTLGEMVKKGCWGVLESVIPPVTGGAWLSMATGKNPGKTGVIDFLNRRDKTYRLHPVSSRDYKGHAVWDYLSAAGRRVGIFNYPMLFPPYEINGFMISGIGASPSSDIAYPPSLKKELDRVSGGYEMHLDYLLKKYEDLDVFLRDLDRFMSKFGRVVNYLVRREGWDFLFLVFSMTDWVQHIMWRHIDEGHFMYDPVVSPRYREEFVKFWQRVDGVIEEVTKVVGEDTVIFIVSDHGFGMNDQTFNLARWLESKGYLVRKRSLKGNIKKLAYRVAVNLARTRLGKAFSSRTKRKVGNMLRAGVEVEIDFERSEAYCLGHTVPFGAIYVNAGSLVERERIKQKIIYDLESISEDIGEKVNVKIYEPRKIYHGERSTFLPDIIFTINNWRCVILEEGFSGVLFENKPFSSRHTGSHRLEGVFLAYGPGVKRGVRVGRVKIYDVAPTILHMFGLPVPDDMDGRVLMDIFEEGSDFARRKPRRVSPGYYVRMLEAGKARKVAKKLRRMRDSGSRERYV